MKNCRLWCHGNAARFFLDSPHLPVTTATPDDPDFLKAFYEVK